MKRYYNPQLSIEQLSDAQDELVNNFDSETDYYLECADKVNSGLNELYVLRKAFDLACEEHGLKKDYYIKKANV